MKTSKELQKAFDGWRDGAQVWIIFFLMSILFKALSNKNLLFYSLKNQRGWNILKTLSEIKCEIINTYQWLHDICVLSHSVVSDSLLPHGLYIACQSPLSMDFSKQEYWRKLQFPTPWDLLNPRIKPTSLTLADKLFITVPLGTPNITFRSTCSYLSSWRSMHLFMKWLQSN